MAKMKPPAVKRQRAAAEDMLDKALAASFPASDPISAETMLIPGTDSVKRTVKVAAKSGKSAKRSR